MSAQKDEDGLKIIHASLYRMGTKSMSDAYETLGFNALHCLVGPQSKNDWRAFERVVDAKWPFAPGAPSKPQPTLTRADWEAIRTGGDRQYDVFTDMFSHFTLDLIRAYPEAKVVVVQRDFDSWWPSYRSRCIDAIKPVHVRFLFGFCYWLFNGHSPAYAAMKQYCGFFGTQSLEEIDEAKARKAYDEFFYHVRRLVPADRRLEFNIDDGWEPLCEYLGKEVPDTPFPRLNSSVEHKETEQAILQEYIHSLLFSAMGIVAVGAAAWYSIKLMPAWKW